MTEETMTQLDQALKDQDLKIALGKYHLLRHGALPPDQVHVLFRYQCKLVQLFHRVRIEKLAGNQAHASVKQLQQLALRRQRVLKDISRRILKNAEYAKSLAALVDALGKSKAMVEHSHRINSTTKLQDWRAALKVLEDWSISNRPWREISGNNVCTGVVEDTAEKATGPLEDPSPISSSSSTSQAIFQLRNKPLERDLATWLTRLMKRLVYSHTYLIRSMLDTIPSQFGIQTTVEMHIVLLEYYAMFGRDGHKDTLAIVTKMNNENIPWKQNPAVYHYLLYSLSHISGNEAQAAMIVEQMLTNDLIPREETMKAAILCAARSGNLELCSQYIRRMHQEWDLTITERMKAILLYACAKRGDFDSALEILAQLSHSGTLVHPKLDSWQKKRSEDLNTSYTSTPPALDIEELMSSQDVVDNSNVLLALINQTHARRKGKKQLSQEFVKEEVSKVLELFTIITRDPKQVDAQLYTIMMQYLSTLPSPLAGMIYLYNEMRGSENTKPNNVTYRIMLEACAEQMDMDHGKQLWKDMDAANIIKDCHVRASYIKGWGRAGHLDIAEGIARRGLQAQEEVERFRMQRQIAFVAKNKRRLQEGLPLLLKPPRLPRRQRAGEMINLSVVHELMKAHRAHNKPERVYELYKEIDAGQWGRRIRPNDFTLSIVLGACSSSIATPTLVDQSIELVDRYLETQRLHRLQHYKDDNVEDAIETHSQDTEGGEDIRDDPHHQWDHQLLGTESAPGRSLLPVLSDVNYQLYYTMLGRHHRQRKMVEVWDDMMKSIERAPSHRTVNFVTEALENVQWGAAPIKRLQRQLREQWPNVDWAGMGRGRHGSDKTGPEYGRSVMDESVGAGGRFWK
ncbi:hypothetical protein BGZ58_004224 [Dissophora ornata]|nr:hypothetical protein BGZ58_004224 [Dissophora ornata]